MLNTCRHGFLHDLCDHLDFFPDNCHHNLDNEDYYVYFHANNDYLFALNNLELDKDFYVFGK